MRRRWLAQALLATIALWATPRAAAADELTDFELAKSRYDVGNYPEAAARFAELVDSSSPTYLKDAKLRQQARVLFAATLVALDRSTDADAVIAKVLREDPAYQPTPGLFPQQVTDRFIAVRAELREELEAVARAQLDAERRKERERAEARAAQARRVADLERMAREQLVISSRSRWVAMLPWGVGQFQNDDIGLGAFFLISETLTTTASIVSGTLAHDYATIPCDEVVVDPETGEETTVKCDQLEEYWQTARAVNWISFSSTLALAVIGIIEAQASFEDETTQVRQRELPPKVKLAPTAAASREGAFVGLVGWF